MIFRSDSMFSLVLDPADMFIVSVCGDEMVNRGTILCSIPLVDVLCAAADGKWLYIAIAHNDEAYAHVGFLIKNGNFRVGKEKQSWLCLRVKTGKDAFGSARELFKE